MEEKKAAISGVSSEERQALDVASLSDEDPISPDSFDVRGPQTSALGNLLDTMPIPALLTQPWLNFPAKSRDFAPGIHTLSPET